MQTNQVDTQIISARMNETCKDVIRIEVLRNCDEDVFVGLIDSTDVEFGVYQESLRLNNDRPTSNFFQQTTFLEC